MKTLLLIGKCCVGVFLFICIYLLIINNYLVIKGFSISENSRPWHFSNNPTLHKKTVGLYEFDKAPDAFFDIDIHDLEIKRGAITFHNNSICDVVFYNIYDVDKEKMDIIVDRVRRSFLSKGLDEEGGSYGKYVISYFFSSKNKRGRSIGITKDSSFTSLYVHNINDDCYRGEY